MTLGRYFGKNGKSIEVGDIDTEEKVVELIKDLDEYEVELNQAGLDYLEKEPGRTVLERAMQKYVGLHPERRKMTVAEFVEWVKQSPSRYQP